MSRHGTFGVDLGSTFIGDMLAVDLGMSSEWMQAATASDIYTRLTTLINQGFQPTFTTGSILAALNVVGPMGEDVSELTGGVKYYFRKRKNIGEFEAIGVSENHHRSFAFSYGFIVPQTLTVNHRGEATLTYALAATSSDGSTSPLTIGENVELTDTLSAPERWALGPMQAGGFSLTQVDSITVNFGNSVQPKSDGDKVYDTGANKERTQPTIVIAGTNLEWVKASGAIAPTGQACTHANTSLGLRKRQDKGLLTANTLTFTAAGTAYPSNPASASGSGDATSEVTIICDYDGTNYPITFAAA